jgi:CHAD domain-containing protein
VSAKTERELKFDVPSGFAVPNVSACLPTPPEVQTDEIVLVSTYYDTTDADLLRQRITLRRRTGDADTGWHLKVPEGPARTEIHVPLDGTEAVPERLRTLIVGISAGRALTPVAVVRTRRHLTRLLSGSEVLAEIADDQVHATTVGDTGRSTEWREVEIELGSGDEQLLLRLGDCLTAAGARAARSSSKLARALGVHDAPPDLSSASGLMKAYLSEQSGDLAAGDVALRRGADVVHKTRVAARRYRSALRVFRRILDEKRATWLDDELSWYQNLLGEVRDRQVLRSRFADALAALPSELVLGPVAADIDATLLGEQVKAHRALISALDSERYFTLMRELRDLAADPALASGATIADVDKLERKARRKAMNRLRAALADHDDVLLHRARKATKRARYARELVVPVRRQNETALEQYKRLQDALGEHQDSVVAAAVLRRLALRTSQRTDSNGFTYGILHEREEEARRRALADAADLLR